jgi:hypothetical protein
MDISSIKDTDLGQDRYWWTMLVPLCLLYLAFGSVNRSMAPLVTPIIRDLHLSYTQMGLILGSWQLTYILRLSSPEGSLTNGVCASPLWLEL